MDAVKEDMKLVDARDEGAERRLKWRQAIGCGLP